MTQTIHQVDAFTSSRYSGNSAAVCLLPAPADEEWMQQVAMEMNLAETSFLVPIAGEYNLRWFTPTTEVDLCGHATIAAAHTLWESGEVSLESPIVFNTRSGKLTAKLNQGWIELDFPSDPPTLCDLPPGMISALGIEANSVHYVGRGKFDYIVEVTGAEAVRALQPNNSSLKLIPTRGIIVTAHSDIADYDFISRFFAPAVGLDEDPVTGSAHCCLASYWHNRLGKTQMVGYQASKRGGVVRVTLQGDRVLLGGQAVTTLRGELV